MVMYILFPYVPPERSFRKTLTTSYHELLVLLVLIVRRFRWRKKPKLYNQTHPTALTHNIILELLQPSTTP